MTTKRDLFLLLGILAIAVAVISIALQLNPPAASAPARVDPVMELRQQIDAAAPGMLQIDETGFRRNVASLCNSLGNGTLSGDQWRVAMHEGFAKATVPLDQVTSAVDLIQRYCDRAGVWV